VKAAAGLELANFLNTATPRFKVEAITQENFKRTQGRIGRIEMINAFNNSFYCTTVTAPDHGRYHIFHATSFAAAGVARKSGMAVYLIDADLDTAPENRCPVWAAKDSRIGLFVNAERSASLGEVGLPGFP
jgi:hypothetical protein